MSYSTRLLFPALTLVLLSACKKDDDPATPDPGTTTVLGPYVQLVYPVSYNAWKGGPMEVIGSNLANSTITINGVTLQDTIGRINENDHLAFRIPLNVPGSTMRVEITKNGYTFGFDHPVQNEKPYSYFTPADLALNTVGRPRYTFVQANWFNAYTNRSNYTDLDHPYEAFYFCDQFDVNDDVQVATGNSVVHLDSTMTDWDYVRAFTSIAQGVDLTVVTEFGEVFNGGRYAADGGGSLVFLRSQTSGLFVILQADPDSTMNGVSIPFPSCQ